MAAHFDDGKDDDALRTIGEVAQALEIKPHVLRYWEQQFPGLRPLKRSGGRRYYRAADVELVERIDRLVNIEGYTLKGAKKVIAEDTDRNERDRTAGGIASNIPSDADPASAGARRDGDDQEGWSSKPSLPPLTGIDLAGGAAKDGGLDAFFGRAAGAGVERGDDAPPSASAHISQRDDASRSRDDEHGEHGGQDMSLEDIAAQLRSIRDRLEAAVRA